jgi:hypothetical protein
VEASWKTFNLLKAVVGASPQILSLYDFLVLGPVPCPMAYAHRVPPFPHPCPPAMQLPIHIVDAFTSEQFKGNQAAVVVL